MTIISPEITTFLVAMTPVSELRGAIPLALSVYKMSWQQAFIWSVLGNIAAVILVLLLLEPISNFLSKRSPLCSRYFSWLFERTRKNHTKRFEVWGALALIAFVAIPLPMTGGWTGSVAAFVFGIPFKKALPLISIGVVIAGVIVTLVSLGVLAI